MSCLTVQRWLDFVRDVDSSLEHNLSGSVFARSVNDLVKHSPTR